MGIAGFEPTMMILKIIVLPLNYIPINIKRKTGRRGFEPLIYKI